MRSTIAFLVMLALGTGVAIFAPFLIKPQMETFIEPTAYVSVFLMTGLGIAVGFKGKYFYFALVAPPVVCMLVSFPVFGYFDWVVGAVAAVAFGVCAISALITSLVRMLVRRRRHNYHIEEEK